jgi:hypothetical protein
VLCAGVGGGWIGVYRCLGEMGWKDGIELEVDRTEQRLNIQRVMELLHFANCMRGM